MGAETGEGVRGVTRKELREEMWRLLEDNLTALQRAVNDPAFSSMTEPYYKAKGAIDFMQTVLDPAIRRWTAALDSGLTDSERETVRGVMAGLRAAAEIRAEKGDEWSSTIMGDYAAALAPIAEGK